MITLTAPSVLLNPLNRLDRMRRIIGTVRKATRSFHRDVRLDPADRPAEWEHEISSRAARDLLRLLNITVERKGCPIDPRPGLLVGNHISYIDVLLLYMETHVSFLAKTEVGTWPIFGNAMRAAGTIFVERENSISRQGARAAAADAILSQGRKIAVFPEGTTSLEGRPWRPGLFAQAQASRIPVQPFRIRYSPVRVCAFIDDDGFVPHLWKILGTQELRATIEYGEPTFIKDVDQDLARLRAWVQKVAPHFW